MDDSSFDSHIITSQIEPTPSRLSREKKKLLVLSLGFVLLAIIVALITRSSALTNQFIAVDVGDVGSEGNTQTVDDTNAANGRYIRFFASSGSEIPALFLEDEYYNYYLNQIGMYEAWMITRGAGATIGTCELVHNKHPDLIANVRGGKDDVIEDWWHAEFTAGVMVAAKNNAGVVGVAHEATLRSTTWPIDAANETHDPAYPALNPLDCGADMINNHHLKIISRSVSEYMPSDIEDGVLSYDEMPLAVRAGYDYARDHGAIIMQSAGNNNAETLVENEGIMLVGTVDANNGFLPASDEKVRMWGPGLDIVAPASNYTKAIVTGFNQESTGTSTPIPAGVPYGYSAMKTSGATPQVSGVAALMLSVNQNLTGSQIKKILKETALDLGAPGEDDIYGAGMLNAPAALKCAQNFNPDVTCERARPQDLALNMTVLENRTTTDTTKQPTYRITVSNNSNQASRGIIEVMSQMQTGPTLLTSTNSACKQQSLGGITTFYCRITSSIPAGGSTIIDMVHGNTTNAPFLEGWLVNAYDNTPDNNVAWGSNTY